MFRTIISVLLAKSVSVKTWERLFLLQQVRVCLIVE
jgi:hypothetical protein